MNDLPSTDRLMSHPTNPQSTMTRVLPGLRDGGPSPGPDHRTLLANRLLQMPRGMAQPGAETVLAQLLGSPRRCQDDRQRTTRQMGLRGTESPLSS